MTCAELCPRAGRHVRMSAGHGQSATSGSFGDRHGASTLQALVLAVRFLGRRLNDFLSTGGRVLDPHGDSDVPLESLFGKLLGVAWA